MFGGFGFVCRIAACLVFGHRFASEGRPALAWFSRITGVLFLAAFVGIASGAANPVVVLGFWAAVVVSGPGWR